MTKTEKQKTKQQSTGNYEIFQKNIVFIYKYAQISDTDKLVLI